VPDLRTFNRDVPREVNEVIQRLLRKDPQDRFQSAVAVSEDLQLIVKSIRSPADTCLVIGATDRRSTLTEPAYLSHASELEDMEAISAATMAGNGSLVFVQGDGGCGKSRLLIEAMKIARSRGLLLLRSHGSARVESAPLAMLEGLISEAISSIDGNIEIIERIKEDMGVLAHSLVAALPKVNILFGLETSRQAVPEAFRENNTIEAVARFLELIGKLVRPTMVFLDDCHNADSLTLRLVMRWERQPKDADRFTTFVVSFRTDESNTDYLLNQVMPERRITLLGFDNVRITQLIESMAGKLPANVIDTVLGIANGNPFVASAVVRGLVEAKVLQSTNGAWKADSKALAIKFTDQGEVRLHAYLDGSTESPLLHIAVHDTGPGIPADRHKAIFESFQQNDSSTTRRYGGTGLGLTITSELVALMGGKIWVESEVGKGSAFHVAIPCDATLDKREVYQSLSEPRSGRWNP
jgi:two-component system sensor kinase